MTYRIWIDQDSVLYDLHTPWLAAHNADYPEHAATIDDHTSWDVTAACKAAGCSADMRSYFNWPSIWQEGMPLENSQRVVQLWSDFKNVQLGVLTTAANAMCMPYKHEWLSKYFPNIRDVIIVNNHLKHLVHGDILIDDGLHNLAHWRGIGICFTQPWNKDADVLRADDWNGVDILVRKALQLLDKGIAHKHIEELLKEQLA